MSKNVIAYITAGVLSVFSQLVLLGIIHPVGSTTFSNPTTINAVAVNDAPVATPQSIGTNEDTPASGQVAGTDAENSPLSFAVATDPIHGTVSLNTDGSFTYTPSANYNGSDEFTFTANDVELTSEPATVSISVTAVNDVPVAQDGTNSGAEDGGTISGSASAADADGDGLTYNLVSDVTVQQGTLIFNSNGSYSYTPAANFNGTAGFSFQANDGQAASNTATLTITVTSVNDAPVAQDGALNTAQETLGSGTLTATDGDNDPASLTYSVVTDPAHGILNINTNGTYTYTPVAGYSGADAFTFHAFDGTAFSNAATINITITAVNHAPVAANGTNNGLEDGGAITGAANATDGDNNQLTYSLVSDVTAQQGSLTFNSDGNYTFTPAPNFNGSVNFSFQANDGQVNSNVATITITVTAVNDAPVAQNGTNSGAEDGGAVTGTVSAADVDGDGLTYNLVSDVTAQQGMLTFSSNGNYSFAPAPNFNGTAGFSFQANDGQAVSNTAMLTITVTPVNDAPVATPQSIGTNEDTPVSGQVAGTDVENSPLSFAVATQPAHGTLSFNTDGSFTYAPIANYNGNDEFTFTANDGESTSAPVKVSINVVAVNDVPVAVNGSASGLEDGGAITGNASASDADGDGLTYSLISGVTVQQGTLTLNSNGSYSFLPTANFNGTVSFSFQANDGQINSNTATITVTVTAVNDAPVAANGTNSGLEDGGAITGTASATDVDGNTLTYSLVSNVMAQQGTLVFNNSGNYSYTPAANFNGTASFSFQANDGQLNSNAATITITVTPVNDAPVAQNGTLSTTQGVQGNGTLIATDVDNAPASLIYSVVASPAHGALNINANGAYTYTPASGYSGADAFTFRASDGAVFSNTATINITITAVNHAPVAANGTNNGLEDGGTVTGTASATDIDGNTLISALVSNVTAQQGTLTFSSNGNYSFVPAPNFNGTASFTFQANDGQLNSNTATVTITVTPVNDAPSFNNAGNQTVLEDAPAQTVTGWATSISAGASNESSQTLSFVVTNNSSSLFATQPAISANGTLTYKPAANASGVATVSVKLMDNGGIANGGVDQSAIQTFIISITAVNDAPIAQNSTLNTTQGVQRSGTLTATDIDNAAASLTYSVVAAPAHGTLVLNAGGAYTFTPAAGYSGPDAFTFRAFDGTAFSNTATISITILPTAPSLTSLKVNFQDSVTRTPVGWLRDYGQAFSLRTSTGQGSGNTYGWIKRSDNTPVDFRAYGRKRSTPADTLLATLMQMQFPSAAEGVWEAQVANGNYDVTVSVGDGQYVDSKHTINVEGVPAVVNFVPGTAAKFKTATVSVSVADGLLTVDGIGGTNTKINYINIQPSNKAPISQDGGLTTTEDNQKAGTLSASDPDNKPASLTYSVVATPMHGTLVLNANGTYTYTPSPDYNGPDAFTFRAFDGAAYSNTATVPITVTAVNDAPSFTKGANQTVLEDAVAQAVTGWATAIVTGPSDESSQTLSFVVTNNNSSLFSIQPAISSTGTLTYTPAPNANGTATVSVKLSDNGGVLNGGVDQSAVQNFTITVTAVNDPPVAANSTSNGLEDGGVITGTVSAADTDNNQLTYALVNTVTAQQGTLTFNSNGSYSYTPAPNFNGTTSFTFQANDGQLNSNTATVTITITPVNDAPVVVNGTLNATQETQVSGTLTATDIDNAAASLTYSVVAAPAHGTLVLNAGGAYTFTPAAGYSGPDAFTFRAFDGTAFSNTATISITILPTAPSLTSLKVNFQDSVTRTPVGWLRDYGQAFSLRTSTGQGSGNTYGWIKRSDNTPVDFRAYGRKRSTPADTLLATLMQMQFPSAAEGVWEAQVANGNYDVTVSVGDGQYVDSKHTINVEGVPAVVNFVPGTAAKFKTATVSVSVADGLLTVDGIGGTNTKINYINIQPSNKAPTTNKIQFTQASESAEVLQGGGQSLLEYISTSNNIAASVQLYAVDKGGVVPSWLSVNGKLLNGISYTAGSEISFGLDATNLSIGKYTASVTASAPGYKSAVLNILLTVKGGTNGTPTSLKVNFQDSVTRTPVGWLRDYGQAFSLRTSTGQGSGNTYGWIKRSDNTPVDFRAYGRKRSTPADTLLATLMQMQFPSAAEGVWEAQVANGNYDVTVSVGDGQYVDSKHTINVEGVPAVVNFVPGTAAKFKTATVSVSVADGLLTVDGIGGTNTKINYINIQPSTSRRPSVVQVNPENGSQNVSDIASISSSILNLPNGGINNNTLSSTTVFLQEEVTKALVPAHVNGTGGGDAITLVPDAPLKLSTSYTFNITDGVKDLSGAAFIPYASSFTTGSVSTGSVTNIKFTKVPLTNTVGQHTSLTIGPDGKLYALSNDGIIKRFVVNQDGTLQDPELIYTLQDAYGVRKERLAIGLVFDPSSTATNLIAYITHCTYAFLNAPDWDGRLSRLSGNNLQNIQDILVNLPRSAKDHVTNSITFGPDGALYFTQGSTSAMGRADQTWSNRDEHLLSAAVLRLDLNKLGVALPLDVKTAEGGGGYNPYDPNAPLTIYAAGIRNAYDLVWHSNGELYTATNGSAAGGNTPASIQGAIRPDGTPYAGPDIPALSNVQQTQKDFLYRIKKGGYYGHPNSLRGQFVLNGGNPTSSIDPAQVNAYPIGTLPDANWRGYAFDFQVNKSPNGSIEYKSNTFGGALKGKILTVRYSQNDDIITLTPGGANNDIVSYIEGASIQGFSGFVDPLDLTEDVRNGNIYVSEYGGEGTITLLRVDQSATTTTVKTVAPSVDQPAVKGSTVDTTAGNNLALKELPEANGLEKPRVYPNPLHQKFTIEFPTVYTGTIHLQLVDVSGKTFELGKSHLLAGGIIMEVDVSKARLAAGIYFLKIYSENRRPQTIKLLIQ